jgi:hypothetical protein
MACGNAGDMPSVQEACTLSCTTQPGSDICTFDPCACTTTGDVCNTAFPATCNLKTTAIYNCAALKAPPVEKVDCLGSGTCFVHSTGPQCTLPDCICQDDGKHCGSTFVGTCDMVSNTLYNCVTGAIPTVSDDCSPGVCSSNIVTDPSIVSIGTKDTVIMGARPQDFKAMATDDFCVHECACKEAGATVKYTRCFLFYFFFFFFFWRTGVLRKG